MLKVELGGSDALERTTGVEELLVREEVETADVEGVNTYGIASGALQAGTDPQLHWWLAEAAAAGDEDAQYALARWFAPPQFDEASQCRICSRPFGITLFRHHCR